MCYLNHRFGIFGVAQTNLSFTVSIMLLMTGIVLIAILRLCIEILTSGTKLLVQQILKPSVDSFLFVNFACLSSLVIAYAFSFIKNTINPMATYGFPELSAVSLAILCFAVFSACDMIWPNVSRWIGLSSSTLLRAHQYDSLPTSELLEFSDSDDPSEAGDSDEELGVSRPLLPPTVPLQHIISLAREKSKVLSSFFPIGMLGFWFCSLIIALVAAIQQISVFYFFYDFALFSVGTLIITFVADYYYRKSLHEDLETIPSESEQRFMEYYENYFWLFQIFLSTTVPLLFFADLFHVLLISIPSVIGEGIPGTLVDMLFSSMATIALLNFLPVISQTDKEKSLVIFSLVFLAFWIPQCFLFPFSGDRPLKYSISQRWNVSHVPYQSNVTIKLMKGNSISSWYKNLPSTNPWPASLANSLESTISFSTTLVPQHFGNISNAIQLEYKMHKGVIHGTITGSVGTRICSFSMPSLDLQSALEVDPKNNWIPYGSNHTRMLRNPIFIYRRSFPSWSRERIVIPFVLRTKSKQVPVRVSCFYPMHEASPLYMSWLQVKPLWTVNGYHTSSEGDFVLEKEFVMVLGG